jgi:hypothetical protein
MSAPFDCTLPEAVGALKSGALSSCELTLARLERARSWQPEINAFLAIEQERSLASADAADSARARGETLGPLHGAPLAHKNMYDRAGRETSCGSKICAGHVSVTATVLERLDAAGTVDLARLNMSEFALGPNAHFGRARNPWNINIATGGSSSGSGAAIAAGRRGRHAVHASLFVSWPPYACAADRLFRRRSADRDAACRAAFRREPAAEDCVAYETANGLKRRLPAPSAAPATVEGV